MSNIRSTGLAYLQKALRGKSGQCPVAVSKIYDPDESPTGITAWWFDLPINNIQKHADENYYLLGQVKSQEFVILEIPNRFFLNNLDIFETRYKNAVRLHLTEDFIEQRGSKNLDFSSFVLGKYRKEKL